MQTRISLVLISINIFIGFSNAICHITNGDGSQQSNLKCDHTTLDEIRSKQYEKISNIFITLSKIPIIEANVFSNFASVVQSLSLQNCEIVDVDPEAFRGLNNLKTLSLNSNNISIVNSMWFRYMPTLKELDLSFNKIKRIDSSVYRNLLNLRKLSLNNNLIVCLRREELEPMSSIEKIRIDGNPLSFTCRGKLTRWFKDTGIKYTVDDNGFKYREDFLDSLIWRCGIDKDIANSELLLKECVFLNLYNQLQTALVTSCSFPSTASECIDERTSLLRCIQQSENGSISNGEAVRRLLLALKTGSKTLRNN